MIFQKNGGMMPKFIFSLILLLTLSVSARQNSYTKYQQFILRAEAKATAPARKVMQTVRHMVEQKVVIRGACWDYLDAAFTRAGYPRGKRSVAHKGSKGGGPYAPASKIRVGDWLYYINHSYHNIEHSGLFIGWINYKKRQGLIMSYAGEGRMEPARYKVYDLSDVYHIMRAE